MGKAPHSRKHKGTRNKNKTKAFSRVNLIRTVNSAILLLFPKFYSFTEKNHQSKKAIGYSSYLERSKSTSIPIQTQKLDVNHFFGECIKTLNIPIKSVQALILDGPRQITRKILCNIGVSNNLIHTVDRESLISDELHYQGELKDFLSRTKKIYGVIWLDAINGTKKMKNFTEIVFQRTLVIHGGIFGITVCPRGETSKSFSHLNNGLKKIATKYGYTISNIEAPANLRLKLQTKGTSKYGIKSFMTDNAAIDKTGRTMSWFYKVSKV